MQLRALARQPCSAVSAAPCRTPLAAGMFSNVLHLGLLVALVFGLGWGVAGAGLATSISHWAGLAFLLATVLGRGYMRWASTDWECADVADAGCSALLCCMLGACQLGVGWEAQRAAGEVTAAAVWKSRDNPAPFDGGDTERMPGVLGPLLLPPCSKQRATRPAVSLPSCRAPDLARPPTWREVAPMLRNGLFLSARSLLAMGSLMWATRLIAGFGAVGLAGAGPPLGRSCRGGARREAALWGCTSVLVAPTCRRGVRCSTLADAAALGCSRCCLQPTRFSARSGCSPTRRSHRWTLPRRCGSAGGGPLAPNAPGQRTGAPTHPLR